ncbi:hypothetical protein Tco_1068468 [Tanacetum coccineum]|uniref:Uncharacterized protein n=1 Tax=Tanacetum coccineum TaxID=301880 RepID=A0ABQ5HG07_9ASTR
MDLQKIPKYNKASNSSSRHKKESTIDDHTLGEINKPQVSSSGGTSRHIDTITDLTKQVEDLGNHIASMQETYNQNQEATIQLMQNQMGQMVEALQERPLEEKQEPETITKVVEISSSQTTPLVLSSKTPPLSAQKPKEYPKPNPYQPQIPYLSRLQKDKTKALESPTGRADYCIYCIGIVDPSSDKIHTKKEKSSGSTTSHSDHSLLEYELFYFDVDLKEFEYLLYHGPSIDLPHIVERSDSHHEEFTDEIAHIIYTPKYDHFYFDIESDPRELTRLLHANSSSPSLNQGILIFNGVHSKRSLILPLNELSPILSGSDLIFPKDSFEIGPLLSFPFGNENKVFNPRILMVDGINSFTRKSPHLPNDNFKINKRHILLKISLNIESFVSFHPMDNIMRGNYTILLKIEIVLPRFSSGTSFRRASEYSGRRWEKDFGNSRRCNLRWNDIRSRSSAIIIAQTSQKYPSYKHGAAHLLLTPPVSLLAVNGDDGWKMLDFEDNVDISKRCHIDVVTRVSTRLHVYVLPAVRGGNEGQPHSGHGELEQRCSAAPLLAQYIKAKGARSAKVKVKDVGIKRLFTAEKANAASYKLVLLDQMRMEQYLQYIDYTLWETIENGNAPIVTKTVDGKETAIPPTSVEEKA